MAIHALSSTVGWLNSQGMGKCNYILRVYKHVITYPCPNPDADSVNLR